LSIGISTALATVVPAVGVVVSSFIAGGVAFAVAAMKSRSDRVVFQSQIDVQLEEHRQSMEKGRTERKLISLTNTLN
jgi:cell division protein FtsX